MPWADPDVRRIFKNLIQKINDFHKAFPGIKYQHGFNNIKMACLDGLKYLYGQNKPAESAPMTALLSGGLYMTLKAIGSTKEGGKANEKFHDSLIGITQDFTSLSGGMNRQIKNETVKEKAATYAQKMPGCSEQTEYAIVTLYETLPQIEYFEEGRKSDEEKFNSYLAEIVRLAGFISNALKQVEEINNKKKIDDDAVIIIEEKDEKVEEVKEIEVIINKDENKIKLPKTDEQRINDMRKFLEEDPETDEEIRKERQKLFDQIMSLGLFTEPTLAKKVYNYVKHTWQDYPKLTASGFAFTFTSGMCTAGWELSNHLGPIIDAYTGFNHKYIIAGGLAATGFTLTAAALIAKSCAGAKVSPISMFKPQTPVPEDRKPLLEEKKGNVLRI